MKERCLVELNAVGCRYRVKKGRLKFGTYNALKSISFSIYKGETIGIIGKNGSGKSSILKIISGIISPNTGNVYRRKGLSISLLSLQAGFSAELSGRDNAIMGSLLMGYTKKEALQRIDRIIDFSELSEWIDEPVKTYSTGMRARLGFSVAMEMSPDILLIDEVFAVGDELFKRKSIHAMKSKLQSGQTVVFVSHQLPLLEEICTRIVWVDKGVVKENGNPKEVLDLYRKSIGNYSP